MISKEFKTIIFKEIKQVGYVILNRPEVHNAFNDNMIEDLQRVFEEIENNQEIRVVVLKGEGKSFCAGADLNWMRRVKDYSYEENLRESLALADMLYKIYTCPKPTIAQVHGYAIGGGTGIVAVCDIAIATTDAKFSFSEVKLGLIPACISPYVVKRCGEGRCREFFLTGERMSAEKAFNAGLVNIVVPPDCLDKAVKGLVDQLISSGPEAIKKCKELLRGVPLMDPDEFKKYTAEVIAQIRISPEAQEGMSAFLEKRKPKWIKEDV